MTTKPCYLKCKCINSSLFIILGDMSICQMDTELLVFRDRRDCPWYEANRGKSLNVAANHF